MVNQKLIFHVILYAEGFQRFLQDAPYSQLVQVIKTGCDKNHLRLATLRHQDDHIHILLEQLDDSPIQKAINQLKDEVCSWRTGESNKTHQLSFALFTVSFSMIEKLSRFIESQATHHLNVSFEEEFIALLDKHDVEQWMLPQYESRRTLNGRDHWVA